MILYNSENNISKPEPSPESFQWGCFVFLRGAWHIKNWQKLNWFVVFRVSICGGLELCLGGLSPKKHLRGDGNWSKPNPNKTFMFQLSYWSRNKAIILSQQSSKVYFTSSYSNEAVMRLTTTEIFHPNFTSYRPCVWSAKLRSTTRPFAQWNLILARLQPSETLEKHENKEKLFGLNMYFFCILIRFCAYSNDSQSL